MVADPNRSYFIVAWIIDSIDPRQCISSFYLYNFLKVIDDF